MPSAIKNAMSQIEYNPCAVCNQKCCYNYTVTVTGYDTWLIAKHLHLALEQFLIYFPASKANAGNFKLDNSEMNFNIALAKRENASDEKPCVFWLSLPGGYARCGIYPLRPLVCKNYPAFLGDGSVHLRTDVVCPQCAWNLSSMNIPLWRERLLRFQMEYDIYCYIVEQWNEYVQASLPEVVYPINVYYGYLMHIYNRLESVRNSISVEEAKSILQRWGQIAENRVNPLKYNGEGENHGADSKGVDFISDMRETINTFFAHKEEEGK
jgi:Fe-S-cluster containining protein